MKTLQAMQTAKIIKDLTALTDLAILALQKDCADQLKDLQTRSALLQQEVHRRLAAGDQSLREEFNQQAPGQPVPGKKPE